MAPRRLAENQPDSFAFSAENAAWAQETIKKYPEGRQASAVIPLMWRAQEQEGWVTRPAIENIADMLDMPQIRVLEVATFYTMFQLQPVGSVAHIQVCGTTPCMLRGSEELLAICKRRIAEQPHDLSDDGRFSWEEMECLGACVNAPMIQITKDTYEDLTPKTFEKLLDNLEKGKAITPGPQVKRQYCEPLSGATTLNEGGQAGKGAKKPAKAKKPAEAETPVEATPVVAVVADIAPVAEAKPSAITEPKPEPTKTAPKKKPAPAKSAPVSSGASESEPALLASAPDGGADNLKEISGVGPKLESTLNEMGIYTFAQITEWTDDHVAWVDARLTFKGRIVRDDWIGQAKALASGADTEFSRRVQSGNVASSEDEGDA
ncbi:MAG: NADH-quinone oxidoreductase subunit NuoE [Alphaproteobacteria bacterium]